MSHLWIAEENGRREKPGLRELAYAIFLPLERARYHINMPSTLETLLKFAPRLAEFCGTAAGFLFSSFLLCGEISHAAPLEPEILDPRSLAMGGALRSLAETQSAARMNPAALSLRRGFFGGVSYATTREGPRDAFQLTVVDNITSPMGGALQYLRLQGPDEREDVSLSLSAGDRSLWWGFTARYVHARARGNSEWSDTVTGDLGFLFQRTGGIRIGVVGYDLLDTSSPFLQRRLAIGASRTGLQGFTVAADVVRRLGNDFSRGVDLQLGAEYTPVGSRWSLRGGHMWRGDTGEDAASIGVGWAKGAHQAGYSVQRTRQEPGNLLHAFAAEASF
jgi:hypothetical protein